MLSKWKSAEMQAAVFSSEKWPSFDSRNADRSKKVLSFSLVCGVLENQFCFSVETLGHFDSEKDPKVS